MAELDAWVAAGPSREVYRISLPNNSPKGHTFHQNVVTLQRLIAEAARLRQEMAKSLASLQAHVAFLAQTEGHSLHPSSERQSLDVFTFDSQEKKVH